MYLTLKQHILNEDDPVILLEFHAHVTVICEAII